MTWIKPLADWSEILTRADIFSSSISLIPVLANLRILNEATCNKNQPCVDTDQSSVDPKGVMKCPVDRGHDMWKRMTQISPFQYCEAGVLVHFQFDEVRMEFYYMLQFHIVRQEFHLKSLCAIVRPEFNIVSVLKRRSSISKKSHE